VFGRVLALWPPCQTVHTITDRTAIRIELQARTKLYMACRIERRSCLIYFMSSSILNKKRLRIQGATLSDFIQQRQVISTKNLITRQQKRVKKRTTSQKRGPFN